jgi:hypothetical protein
VPELHSVFSGLKKMGLLRGQVALLPEQNTLFKHSLKCMHTVEAEANEHEFSQHGP